MENKIEELIEKYNAGLTDPAEISQLEKLIEDGIVDLTQLRDLDRFDNQINAVEPPATSLALDDKFYAMLGKEKKKQESSAFSFTMPSWSWLAPRLAFSVMLIAAGFAGGFFLNSGKDNVVQTGEIAALTQEVSDLKETMMLSLLEKESATDRLKAVSLTTDMDHASAKVTDALFKTLNSDPSVNVRLAALEAIMPYAKIGKVREGLIRSITQQESPIIQVALADLMVQLQEKKSVAEFDKIVKDKKTPPDVKKKIQESINVLI